MKAVVFEEHGGPEVLSYTEIPDPEPKPYEVLIEVKAAGANFNDIWARRGMPGMKVIFPHVSGSDVSGVVAALGSEVSGVGFGSSPLQVGDEVVVHPGLSCRTCDFCVTGQEFFCRQFRIWGFQSGPNDGGHSEFVTMPAVNVLPKPANLSFEEAASMPLVLETAWRMLVSRARIQPGEHVLLWGGVGGLGTMAIQICRMFGANPIPVVGGAEKVAKASSLAP
jgi:NADPH:quinone reductase-like Zn-dependent oxidoreductase